MTSQRFVEYWADLCSHFRCQRLSVPWTATLRYWNHSFGWWHRWLLKDELALPGRLNQRGWPALLYQGWYSTRWHRLSCSGICHPHAIQIGVLARLLPLTPTGRWWAWAMKQCGWWYGLAHRCGNGWCMQTVSWLQRLFAPAVCGRMKLQSWLPLLPPLSTPTNHCRGNYGWYRCFAFGQFADVNTISPRSSFHVLVPVTVSKRLTRLSLHCVKSHAVLTP